MVVFGENELFYENLLVLNVLIMPLGYYVAFS